MTSQPLLDIAIANSRFQETWNQEQWSFDRLVKRLQFTHRTAESFATYSSSTKQRQMEIKDIGGFVGGYLIEGKRRKGFVKHRQLVALDIDFAYADLWSDFTTFYANSAICYSTHSHSIVNPRLRLLIPLDRPVGIEEYEAISRKIASIIGMKCFDRTTFAAERLMYFPSTSKDGDYYFRQQEGEWLSADEVLAEYTDWRNVAEWPLCPTESEIIKSDLKKQADPGEKEGVIGAFCRVYTIEEAMAEFIPGKYTSCGGDRFTYCEGTTAAGAVCYDDKFLYSHHSTDPCCAQLVNAFDLVRIHKFGHLDTDPNLPLGKRPSFGAMLNLARTDAGVVKEIGIFNLDIEEGQDTDWLDKMDVDKKGNYNQTIDNFLLILRNDPKLKNKFAYNEFDYLLYVKDGQEMRTFADADDSALRLYFEKKYNLYHAAKCRDAFEIAAKDSAWHPVRDYLNTLTWDGIPRLDTLFIDQFGVVDTLYTRAATRKSLVAAVARVMDPGCKYDTMPVLIGSQGKGKSSLLRDLGHEWFSDTLDGVTGKEAYMQLQGVWIMEMAELSSIKNAEVEAIKKFLSAQKDRYRVPFAKNATTFKRQGVPFGSTNSETFLKDPTGNRRFWPLVVTKKYIPGTIDRDPIWAEAIHYYRQGETLYLTEELEAMAAVQQSAHAEADERHGLIHDFIEMKLPENWSEMSTWERTSYVSAREDKGTVERTQVCAAEIWTELFKNNFAEMTPYNTKYIHNILQNMPGWEKGGTLNFKKYGNQRSYVRVSVSDVAAMVAEQFFEL